MSLIAPSIAAVLFNEVRLPGAHVPNFSLTDCDKSIERKLAFDGHALHVYIEEECWDFVSRNVVLKREQS